VVINIEQSLHGAFETGRKKTCSADRRSLPVCGSQGCAYSGRRSEQTHERAQTLSQRGFALQGSPCANWGLGMNPPEVPPCPRGDGHFRLPWRRRVAWKNSLKLVSEVAQTGATCRSAAVKVRAALASHLNRPTKSRRPADNAGLRYKALAEAALHGMDLRAE
jgi:hypothetical protein